MYIFLSWSWKTSEIKVDLARKNKSRLKLKWRHHLILHWYCFASFCFWSCSIWYCLFSFYSHWKYFCMAVCNVISFKLIELLQRQYLDTTFQWLRSNGNEATMAICICFCLDHERHQKLIYVDLARKNESRLRLKWKHYLI